MKKISLFILSMFYTCALANVNIYSFDKTEDEARFKELITELRCPKCQNQNIADSDAPLAQDLKNYVYTMVKDGRADSEIIGFMVDRYGDFVTYKPPVKPITWFLWFAPASILILILTQVLLRKRKTEDEQIKPLTIEEKQQLDTLLKGREDQS